MRSFNPQITRIAPILFLTLSLLTVSFAQSLIIDYSGSQLPYINNSVAAAKVLVDKLAPKDLMAIVTDDVEMILDFTNDKKELKKKLDSLLERTTDRGFFRRPRYGHSKQYSALMATLNEAFTSEDVRPIIIFQTDGDEAFFLRNPIIGPTLPPDLEGEELKKAQERLEQRKKQIQEASSEFSLDDLYRVVESSRATVYTVIPGYKHLGLTPEEQVASVRAAQEKNNADLMARMSPKSREKLKKVAGAAGEEHVGRMGKICCCNYVQAANSSGCGWNFDGRLD